MVSDGTISRGISSDSGDLPPPPAASVFGVTTTVSPLTTTDSLFAPPSLPSQISPSPSNSSVPLHTAISLLQSLLSQYNLSPTEISDLLRQQPPISSSLGLTPAIDAAAPTSAAAYSPPSLAFSAAAHFSVMANPPPPISTVSSSAALSPAATHHFPPPHSNLSHSYNQIPNSQISQLTHPPNLPHPNLIPTSATMVPPFSHFPSSSYPTPAIDNLSALFQKNYISSPSTTTSPTQIPSPNITNLVSIKLDADNFLLWKSQFSTVLISYDLFGYIDGTIACPPSHIQDITGAIILNPSHSNWIRTDSNIKSWLTATISQDIFREVHHLSTSRDIWNTLENRFLQQSTAKQLQYKLELSQIKNGELTCDQYLSKLKTLADNLAAVNHPVSSM